MDPIVTQSPEGQLVYFPSVGTLGDFSDDGLGVTKHKDDIWKKSHVLEIRRGQRLGVTQHPPAATSSPILRSLKISFCNSRKIYYYQYLVLLSWDPFIMEPMIFLGPHACKARAPPPSHKPQP